MLEIDMSISCESILEWMAQNRFNETSTMAQLIAGCCQLSSITWANVDSELCQQMLSLSHNELIKQNKTFLSSTGTAFHIMR